MTRFTSCQLFGRDIAFFDHTLPEAGLLVYEFFGLLGISFLNFATKLCNSRFDFR